MSSTPNTALRMAQLARRRGRARRLRTMMLVGAALLAAAAIVLSQTLNGGSELSLNSPATLPLDI